MSWTVRRMLGWMSEDFAGRGLDSPRLDAEVLLAHALELQRVKLYLDLDRPLTADERTRVRALVVRRRAHEPVAYILGRRDFYSRPFLVDHRVLIPRPDTETLVDQALARIPTDEPGRALDLCTGSGCVGITLAAERPAFHVDVTDVDAGALAVARQNAEDLGTASRMAFLQGDLWDCVDARGYDLVVANPPYVTEREYEGLSPGVREHEPRRALVGGDDGLDLIRRIAAGALAHLGDEGHLLVEVGHTQASAVRTLLGEHFPHVASHTDLGGVARVVSASRVAPRRTGGEPHVDHSELDPASG